MTLPRAGHPPAFDSEYVHRLLAGRLPVNNGVNTADYRVSGPISAHRHSRTFVVQGRTWPTPIAVKLCIDAQKALPDRDVARIEYEGLVRTYDAMADDSEFSVPKPYLLDMENGLLLREWIAGTSLTDLLFSWHCSQATAETYITKAGRWLRAFHEAGPLHVSRLSDQTSVLRLDELSREELAKDEVFAHALCCLGATADIVTGLELEWSWIHGDFKSDNLVISGNRTVGLDVYKRMENAVFFDLGPFLNHLELNLWRPTTLRWRQAIDQLAQAFLAAYKMPNDPTNRTALNWIQLLLILSLWTSTAAEHRGRVSEPFVRAVFRAAVRRIASRLKGAPG